MAENSFSQMDRFFMNEALYEARLARFVEEVPVGAVIVFEGKIIGRGHNFTYKGASALYHAEMIAISQANSYIGDFRLEETTMYVTMEPCSMCAGAIINSRIKRLVIGLPDHKRGACGSNSNVINDQSQLHWIEPEFGLMEEEALFELQSFFKLLRARSKKIKEESKKGS